MVLNRELKELVQLLSQTIVVYSVAQCAIIVMMNGLAEWEASICGDILSNMNMYLYKR